MEALIVGVVLAALSGTAWMAYNKPNEFEKLWNIVFICLYVVGGFVGGALAGLAYAGDLIRDGVKLDKLPIFLAQAQYYGLIAVCVLVAIFAVMFFFSTFPLWLNSDKKP